MTVLAMSHSELSRKRGKPSNRSHSDVFRERVIARVREHYIDFGATLISCMLLSSHISTTLALFQD